MRMNVRIPTAVFAMACSASWVFGATVTGSVKGPDGTPFKGAFVQAENKKMRMTVSVLSDKEGRYHIERLPAGDYDVKIRAVGYKSDARSGVTLAESQNASFDFALASAPVRWSEISFYEGSNLMPPGKGKNLLEQSCLECHSFESRMAAVPRNEEGWTQAVNYMRDVMKYRVRVADEDAVTIASYMNTVFGQDAKVPRNVSDLPDYKKFVHPPFADEAMKIVYVSYDLPRKSRMPFSAAPDKNGALWIPYFSPANAIARLDPKTGQLEEFRVPFQGNAMIHSAVPAPDGTVWLAEQGSNRVGKWDPQTREITEFQDAYLPGKEGLQGGGSKHTVRVDPKGNVWSTGSPLTSLDPKTGKFTRFMDVPSPYGIAIGGDGIVWFANFGNDNKIGKVDPATGKVTTYVVPSPKARPRRIQVDADGIVWFAEFGISPGDGVKYSDGGAGKIGRFDPKTETFKEFPLPGRSPSPYAFGLDKQGRVWYSNMHEDLVGCLDPKTGKVVEYPLPFSENTMREFFLDDQGRVWWGSPANDKVGYFYLAEN